MVSLDCPQAACQTDSCRESAIVKPVAKGSRRGSRVAQQMFTAGSVAGVSTVRSWLIDQFDYGFHGSAHGCSVFCQAAMDTALAGKVWLISPLCGE